MYRDPLALPIGNWPPAALRDMGSHHAMRNICVDFCPTRCHGIIAPRVSTEHGQFTSLDLMITRMKYGEPQCVLYIMRERNVRVVLMNLMHVRHIEYTRLYIENIYYHLIDDLFLTSDVAKHIILYRRIQ